MVTIKDADQDVLGSYREGNLVEILVIQARGGHVKDTLSFSLRGVELPADEVLAGFLTPVLRRGPLLGGLAHP